MTSDDPLSSLSSLGPRPNHPCWFLEAEQGFEYPRENKTNPLLSPCSPQCSQLGQVQ